MEDSSESFETVRVLIEIWKGFVFFTMSLMFLFFFSCKRVDVEIFRLWKTEWKFWDYFEVKVSIKI